jgi:ABC-type lipoprotein release transport system permease subunit
MAATLFLVLTGLAAGSIPALHAARVQPTQALRSE